MGAVYIARDTKLQRQVALKHLILAPGINEEEKLLNILRQPKNWI